MNDILEQLNRKAKAVTLTHEEKASMKAQLALRMQKETLSPYVPVRSPFIVSDFTFIRVRTVMAALLIVTILSVTSGVSYAAEKALPGDALYSVKTNFNEAIIDLVAVSSESKAKVQAQFAEKRLAEAQELIAQNKLDDQKKEVIKQKFKDHAKKVERQINDLTAKKDIVTAVAVSSDFEASLAVHKEIVSNLASSSPEQNAIVADLEAEIESEALAVAGYRSDAEKKIEEDVTTDVHTAVEDKKKEAEKIVDDVIDLFEDRDEDLNRAQIKEMVVRIELIEGNFELGEKHVEEGKYAEAYVDFNTVVRYALELRESIQLILNNLPEEDPEAVATTTATTTASTTVTVVIPEAEATSTASTTVSASATSSQGSAAPAPTRMQNLINSAFKIIN